MKLLLTLSCFSAMTLLVIGAPSKNELDDWIKFKVEYGKEYSPKEERQRMAIFLENKKQIEEHNQQFKKGLVSFTMGINKFSDLTETEFRNMKNGFIKLGKPRRPLLVNNQLLGEGDLPQSVDWRENNAVTPVKEQKQCRSCWIFSAVGAVESLHFIKTGKLVNLSEQNVLDCVHAPQDPSGICLIGWMDTAFEYILNNGIDTTDSYPYEAQINTCRFNKDTIGATITGYRDLPSGDEETLQKAVAMQPVSVAIDSMDGDFQHYKSGVYSSDSCQNSEDKLDHALLVIGYGEEGGLPYWLVKNSWGTTWGDNGYAKILRNKDNHCGIATKASFPIID